MAKTKMLCPFTNKLCRECAQYRGRHYYLCYCSKYRGYIGDPEERTEQEPRRREAKEKFDLPSQLTPSPTWLVLNEFAERKGK
jgi:hypothetical protein